MGRKDLLSSLKSNCDICRYHSQQTLSCIHSLLKQKLTLTGIASCSHAHGIDAKLVPPVTFSQTVYISILH